MTKEVIWSPSAENDLILILEYLQIKWGNKVLINFLNKMDAMILVLKEEPNIFPIINFELQIRKCVLTKQNTLFYRVSHHKIEIIRLFDTRQNPDKLSFF